MNEILYLIEEVKDHDHRQWIKKSLYRSISDCKKRAKRKNIKCNIEHEDIDHLLFINSDRCSVSGIKFKRRDESHYRNPYAPSIDRIDSSKGYIKGNIRLVAYCINNAMNEWGEDIIKEIANSYKTWNTHI